MLKSFCIGCRYEKMVKNHEPCSTICQARIHYVNKLEDPGYILPNEFLRGNDMITLDDLAESFEHPIRAKRKLSKIPEPGMRNNKIRPNPTSFTYKLNRENNLEEGFKYCPDCPIEDGPLPLSKFYKNASGFRGRQGRCKKHHNYRFGSKKTKKKPIKKIEPPVKKKTVAAEDPWPQKRDDLFKELDILAARIKKQNQEAS